MDSVEIVANVQISFRVSRQEFITKSSHQLLMEKMAESSFELCRTESCGPVVDGFVVDNRCTECGEFESECMCEELDAAEAREAVDKIGAGR